MSPWLRPALVAVAVGAGAATVVGVILVAIGFGIRMETLVVWGMAVGVVVWFFSRRFTGLDDAPPAEPEQPPARRSAGLDRRTRQLENQIRNARPGRATTASDLHATLAELVGTGPAPPAVAAYLSGPPRPLDDAALHALLKELIDP